jgi:spore germination cell wall hydrolase CwlJ-like protein
MKYLNLWSLLTVVVASVIMAACTFQPEKITVVENVVAETPAIASTTEKLKITVYSDEVLRELECLAINIYKEAGYEPVNGRIAVAQVTLNRVEHREFPNTVCGVVYEKTRNRHTGKLTVCQFSWYCDPVHRNRPVHQLTYEESYEIAKKVLIDGVRLPRLENAIFYHADYINPNWPYPRITKIGQHIFYEPRNRVVLASN